MSLLLSCDAVFAVRQVHQKRLKIMIHVIDLFVTNKQNKYKPSIVYQICQKRMVKVMIFVNIFQITHAYIF